MKIKRRTMHIISVPEGDIIVCKSISHKPDYWYDWYTRSNGFGDLVYQFGGSARNIADAIDIAIGNYENNNMIWENENIDCLEDCEQCESHYTCSMSSFYDGYHENNMEVSKCEKK